MPGGDIRQAAALSAQAKMPSNSSHSRNSSVTTVHSVASGAHVKVSINLAEPVLFLQGFDQNDMSAGNTAMLRGNLHLEVAKSTKIKAVTLKFNGQSVTKWPEGIPPRKVDFEERSTIMNHTWPFFNAQFPTAESGTCADHVELFQAGGSVGSPSLAPSSPYLSGEGVASSKDIRRLSLQNNQSRSFNRNDSATNASTVAAKGYRTFHPGNYVYNFELPIDSKLPETIDVELGNVKYELEAIVERPGILRQNLVGTREVHLIRCPAEGSLETVEPIAISRNWEDQLHYDIVISGKSFPLGSQVPIAFKLTPLAKVQCHRIKVLVTENIEYFCSNKRVHRMEPTRKLQLFEKRSDSAPTSTFAGSTMRVTAGGGIPYDARVRAANGENVPTSDPTNLLGDLRSESNSIGPTEMEFSVQLPDCSSMKNRERNQRLHFDTTYTNIQVHHWIKIVMRLSRPDTDDPNKRRHFEISIDSPFHILSCRATQANTSLPAYGVDDVVGNQDMPDCGCPSAPRRRNSPPSFQIPNARNSVDVQAEQAAALDSLTRPQAAHVHTSAPRRLLADPQGRRSVDGLTTRHPGRPMAENIRPMDLIRGPSIGPPAFDHDQPPPALITPPPPYDNVASPSTTLADYFSRRSFIYGDEGAPDDTEQSGGQITPGAGRARSVDLPRGWAPIGASAL